MNGGPIDDKPVHRLAVTYWDFFHVVTHPAFRLGFLDAMRGRPVDHDRIVQRILTETKPSALARVGWNHPDLFLQKRDCEEVAVAQYRYEEGRLMQIKYGLRCRGWNHPDFPPVSVEAKIRELAKEREGQDSGDQLIDRDA